MGFNSATRDIENSTVAPIIYEHDRPCHVPESLIGFQFSQMELTQ